ncbi:twin-arginine translocation signal domain-containing protein, partial [Ralstonia solanacearum]
MRLCARRRDFVRDCAVAPAAGTPAP